MRNYAGRVVPDVGLCLLIEKILHLGDQYIIHNDCNTYITATFTSIFFRPFIGEILTGTIVSQNASAGIGISIGFCDTILVPTCFLPSEVFYDEAERAFVWNVDDNRLVFDTGAEARFKVSAVKFRDNSTVKPPTLATKANEDAAYSYDTDLTVSWVDIVGVESNFIIIGRMDGVGFGVVDWWAE